eukprot:Awhi_evm2s1520
MDKEGVPIPWLEGKALPPTDNNRCHIFRDGDLTLSKIEAQKEDSRVSEALRQSSLYSAPIRQTSLRVRRSRYVSEKRRETDEVRGLGLQLRPKAGLAWCEQQRQNRQRQPTVEILLQYLGGEVSDERAVGACTKVRKSGSNDSFKDWLFRTYREGDRKVKQLRNEDLRTGQKVHEENRQKANLEMV